MSDDDEPRREGKSPEAFRTISEVAFELELPQHVLRFWETKFPQVRPMKRGGGRRYYRPEDVALLRRIRNLLHDEGYTIKGVQKLLRQGGLADKEKPAPEPAARAESGEPPRRGPIVYPMAVESAAPPALELTQAALPPPPERPEEAMRKEKRKAALSEALGELEDLKDILHSTLR